MSVIRHRDFQVQRLSIGEERQPLLVVDNVFAHPDQVLEAAVARSFTYVANNYPGVRTKVSLTIQQFLLGELKSECAAAFNLGISHFTSCHFSLITTPAEQLSYLQRIPHIDSLLPNELALVLYLFKNDQGGTAFYRHRKTHFEYIDLARKDEYYRYIGEEGQSAAAKALTGYISGDTEFYERIGRQAGIFNRMLIYRRTSLHSADLGPDLQISSDPRRGRLTLNGFLA
jgi:hypothetical protein